MLWNELIRPVAHPFEKFSHAYSRHADDITEVIHQIEKGWKLKLVAAPLPSVQGCGRDPSFKEGKRRGG